MHLWLFVFESSSFSRRSTSCMRVNSRIMRVFYIPFFTFLEHRQKKPGLFGMRGSIKCRKWSHWRIMWNSSRHSNHKNHRKCFLEFLTMREICSIGCWTTTQQHESLQKKLFNIPFSQIRQQWLLLKICHTTDVFPSNMLNCHFHLYRWIGVITFKFKILEFIIINVVMTI